MKRGKGSTGCWENKKLESFRDVAERKRYRNKELVKTSASLNEYHNRYIAERMMSDCYNCRTL